jgi:tetratricopeptide (TPR) repeat protein
MTERTTALAHLNRKTEADAQADAMLALNPDDPRTLNSVCYLRATQRLDLRKGLAECERASAASPRDAAIIDSRGFAKLQLERHAEAMADFEAALSMNPKQVESLYGRGIARLRLGQTAAGQADLASAETMQPGIGALWRSYGIVP